jgi:uncharacterized membrane protein YkvA (DUF1232 family)
MTAAGSASAGARVLHGTEEIMSEVFDERSFWKAVKRYTAKVPFMADVVALYFCMIDDATPLLPRATIATGLVYFLSPWDTVPDMIPFVGWTDDAAVIAGVFALVQKHVTHVHKRMAMQWLVA